MVGIIGFGKMGEAIGLSLKSNFGEEVGVFDVDGKRRRLAEEKGLTVFSDNAELVSSSEIVILAVKPQVIECVADEIRGRLDGKLVVSIAAGVSCEKLKKILGIDRVVRVMPNTPALVSEGAVAVSFCGSFSEEERQTVLRLLSALGRTFEVPEGYMDAV
ncbi:MAG: NAD(P)-binding domain-containing protein, partial [Deferribacteres bacterium]|nr:NAD(P)-binding domain-containing protein [Deferribacteres bacterium]